MKTGSKIFAIAHIKIRKGDFEMAKDSQIDKKDVRKEKAGGGATAAMSKFDNGAKNGKKQSGNRTKAGDDKK